MNWPPESIVIGSSGIGLVLVLFALARATLSDRRAAWWAAGSAAALATGLATRASGPTMLAALLLAASLLARSGPPRAPTRVLAAALAIGALITSPPIGIAAIALSAWRAPRAYVNVAETAIGAALIIVLDLDPTKRLLGVLAATAALVWLATARSTPFGRIPTARTTNTLARSGAAAGIFALLLIDSRRGLIAPDAFWTAILYAGIAAGLGGLLAVGAVGAFTLMAVRDEARALTIAIAVGAVLVALLSLTASVAALMPTATLSLGVGMTRAQVMVGPALRALTQPLHAAWRPRRD